MAAQNQQMQDIRPDNQRLVYQGHILTPDTKVLSTIPRLESGKTIIVTTVDPSQARVRIYNMVLNRIQKVS